MFLVAATTLLLSQEGENYPHLKRVEWVVGSWTGHGNAPGFGAFEDEFVLEWTYDKNFIKSTYIMKSGGKVIWTDTGFLGWDGEKKRIVGINFGMDGTIGWGRELESEKDTLVVEGRTAGPVVKEEFRAVFRKTGEDTMTVSCEFKKNGKYGNSWPAIKYDRKKSELTKVPDDPKARLNYEHLKGLEFLSGRWTGKGESVQGAFDFETSYDWALNKNFLVTTGTARAMGQVVWTGTAWIGWDVDKKKIVWIGFSHDGTLFVGEAVETKEKNTLVVEGTAGTQRMRRTLRRTEDGLSLLIERDQEGAWVTDKKFALTRAK